MKLSFIIPLYNAEAYIGKCLDSILNSDIDRKEFEIIVIDDGSKDNGQAVVKLYAQKYDNIKLLVQENQGQSVARNYGIREAQGKYVWFVDSDDYVDATKISSVLEDMDRKNVQICKFNMNVYRQDGNNFISNIPELTDGCIYTGQQLFEKHCAIGSVCNSFFLRKFIIENDFTFYPGIIHQDSEFSIRSTALAESILYVSKPFYVYRYNTESSTRSRSYDKVLKSHVSDAIIAHNVLEFVKQTALNGTLSNYLNDFAYSLLMGRIYSYILQKIPYQYDLAKSFIDKMKELGEYPLSKQHLSFKGKLLASLSNCRGAYLSIVRLRQML